MLGNVYKIINKGLVMKFKKTIILAYNSVPNKLRFLFSGNCTLTYKNNLKYASLQLSLWQNEFMFKTNCLVHTNVQTFINWVQLLHIK